MLPRTVKERMYVYTFIKSINVLFGKKSLLNGVEKVEKNFEKVKNKINEDNLSQRAGYQFPKHERIDQLVNVFVFGLETYNDQGFGEANAAIFNDVYRLRDKW